MTNLCSILPNVSKLADSLNAASVVNGKRVTLEFVDKSEDGDTLTHVQIRRIQNHYVEVLRITHRKTLWGGSPVAVNASWTPAGWRWKIHHLKLTTADPITLDFPVLPEPFAVTWEDRYRVEALAIAASTFDSEGAFLDWLAYKSPLEIVADSLYDIGPEHVNKILDHFQGFKA